MKSIKMFGKKIPILGILLIAMIASGGVYAALVSYLSNTITTPVTMSSPIELSATLKYWPVAKGFFTTASGGVAEWSSEESKSGYSAKLSVSLPADEARLAFSHDGLLKDVGDITYNSYVQGLGGGQHPAVVLGLDTDGDGGQDAWVVQWECSGLEPNGENAWIETTFSGTTYVHVAGTRTGLPEGDYVAHFENIEELETLNELRDETFEGSVTWGDLPVVRIKIYLGEVTGLAELITAYVDDISGAVESNCDPVERIFDVSAGEVLPIMGGDTIFASGTVENRANNPVDFVTAIVVREAYGKAWTLDDSVGVQELEAYYWWDNDWQSLDSTTLIVGEHLVILVGGGLDGDEVVSGVTISPGASSTTDHKFVTASTIEPSTYTVKVVVVASGTPLTAIPGLAGFSP